MERRKTGCHPHGDCRLRTGTEMPLFVSGPKVAITVDTICGQNVPAQIQMAVAYLSTSANKDLQLRIE